MAQVKLAASRAFWLVATPALFDAHARAFAAFDGMPQRRIYGNMKTAVDRVGRGKERTVNVRFYAMCSHCLFEPDFCNRAAGWRSQFLTVFLGSAGVSVKYTHDKQKLTGD